MTMEEAYKEYGELTTMQNELVAFARSRGFAVFFPHPFRDVKTLAYAVQYLIEHNLLESKAISAAQREDGRVIDL